MTATGSLQRVLLDRLERAGSHPAIGFYGRHGSFKWMSYESLHGAASAYAWRLREDFGVQRGDVCIMVLPSDELCAHLALSVVLLGAVPLLVAPPTIHGEAAFSSLESILDRIIERVSARAVVCGQAMKPMRTGLSEKHPTTQFAFGEAEVTGSRIGELPGVETSDSDTVAMQLTSGTTGFPRVCVWEQRAVLAALEGMSAAMDLRADDICLNWTPLYHDMGLVNNFLLCLASGTPLVMLKPQEFVAEPAVWLRGLSQTKATVSWSPNFGFALAAQRIRPQEIDGVSLAHVRALWNAAERIHRKSMQDFFERFNSYGLRHEALKTNYGCAENVGGATFSNPNGEFVWEVLNRQALHEEGTARRVPSAREGDEGTVTVVGVGSPYPGMQVKVLGPNGQSLPEGRVGEIALRTPSGFSGYLGEPEVTQQAFDGSWILPGDLGYLRGDQLFWVGRKRERINVRGKNVDPSEFEPILLEIEGLRKGRFAVFGVDDEQVGTQRVVVIAELNGSEPGGAEKAAKEIRWRLLKQLSINVHKVILVRRNTLTKTSSGKRRHRYFKGLYLRGELDQYQLGGG